MLPALGLPRGAGAAAVAVGQVEPAPKAPAMHRASRKSMAFMALLVVSTTADRPRMALMR